jgi:TonB family protein
MLLLLPALAVAVAAQNMSQVPPDEAALHVIKRVEPKYPSDAELARIQGVVLMRVTINELGRVTDAKPVMGHPLLVAPAISAVRSWEFEPFLDNGKPVAVDSQIRLLFTLSPGADHYYQYLQREAECRKQIFKSSFSDADSECKKALAIAVKLPEKPDLDKTPYRWGFEADKMRAYGNAGSVAYELKNYDEALEDFKQQLNLARKTLRPEDPQIVKVHRNLVHTYLAANQLPEAEAEYTAIEKAMQAEKESLEARRDTIPPEAFAQARASYAHNLGIILQEHAVLLAKMGKPVEAQELQRRASLPLDDK